MHGFDIMLGELSEGNTRYSPTFLCSVLLVNQTSNFASEIRRYWSTIQHFDANRPIRHHRLGRLDDVTLSQTQTKYTSRCMVDMSILIEHTKSGVEPSRIIR